MKSASQLRYIESARFGNQLTRRAKAKKRAPNSGRAERMDQTGQKTSSIPELAVSTGQLQQTGVEN